MVTKTLICDWCGTEFQKTAYPSQFKYNREHYKGCYCSKYCAMVGAREGYRPSQDLVLANNGHLMSRQFYHPNRNANNQVPYAHLVMEKHIGRYLESSEVVHHTDGNPLNNAVSNLELMTLGEHVTIHNNLKERDDSGRFVKSMS